MKTFLLYFLLLIVNLNANAQGERFKHRVWIPKWLDVQERLRVKESKAIVLDSGTIVKNTQVYKLNGVDYEAIQTETLKQPKSINVESIVTKLKTTHIAGWANLTQKKDTIFINYWLKNKNVNSDADYFFTIKNRHYQPFAFKAAEIGAITIPFRFRPKISKGAIDVPNTVSTDLNVGLYGGYTLGRVIYRYRKNEDPDPKEQLNFTLGPFVTLSSVALDKNNTMTSDEPITGDSKFNVAAFSTGLGVIAAVNKVRFGVFYGLDFGIGNLAQKWDYNRRPWFGFGFGFNVISLGKS